MQARVLHGDAQLHGQRREQSRLVGRQRAAARKIDGEQADQLVRHRQGHGHRCLHPGGQRQIERRLVDGEHAAGAEGPLRELEQALRDLQVGAAEPAGFGDGQALFLVAQVDGQAVHAEQRRHAVGRRLEGVAEREARDRLAEHGEEGLCALEVARQPSGPLAQAECVRSPDAEAGEALELGLARVGVGGEAQLQRGEGRPPEHDRDEVALHGHHPVVHERPCRRLLRVHLRSRAEAAQGREPRPLPDEGRERACGLRGEAADLVGRPRVLEPGGERVSGQVEWASCPRSSVGAVRGAECPHDEGRLAGREPRDALIVDVQRPARPVELEAADHP